MIWYFALVCLMFFNYPFSLILGSLCFLYLLYVFSGFLYYLNVVSYLRDFRGLRGYYAKKWYILPLMPFYNLFCFWIRFAAIINSITRRNGWKASTFAEEKRRFSQVVRSDFTSVGKIIRKLRVVFNNMD